MLSTWLRLQMVNTRESVMNLRDILKSNTPGGTIDLVWGPSENYQDYQPRTWNWDLLWSPFTQHHSRTEDLHEDAVTIVTL